MNKNFRFVLIPFLFCLAAALPAGCGKEKGVQVQVTGKVRLVGTGLFPQLVVTAPDKEWYIEKDEEHKLKDLQQRTVTLEGRETVKTLTFASGLPAGERRTLKKIKILAVEESCPASFNNEPPQSRALRYL
jgi:hypothetical protein